MRRIGIAALQLELGPGNNLDAIAREIATVRRRFPWVDLVVLAELSTYGVALERAETLPGPAENRYRELAREHGFWLLPGSLYERAGDRIYNTSPVIDPSGTVVARHRKIYPFTPYEQGVACGDRLTTFDVPGIGRFYVTAIAQRDYGVIMAMTILYAAAIAVMNLVVDVLYAYIDPRIRYS